LANCCPKNLPKPTPRRLNDENDMDPFRASDAEWINREPILKEHPQTFRFLSCWLLNPEERPSVIVTI